MKSDLASLANEIPGIVEQLAYATASNFTGKALYPPCARAYLCRPAANRLKQVSQDLACRGLKIKIFDAYRPFSVQKKFWEICPDPRYVADPAVGSRHNRGMAVDLTLLDESEQELEMPSSFDDFSEKASRSYLQCSAAAQTNRRILEEAMASRGFLPYPHEWWHFDAPGWEKQPLLDIAFEDL